MKKPPLLLPSAMALALALSACGGGRPAATEETNLESNAAVEAAAAPEGNAALPEEAAVPPAPHNAAAGPAGRDEYSWMTFRSAGGEGFPVLIYGAAGNDELVINFQCREPGQITALQMRDARGKGRGEPIIMESGGERLQLDVTLGPDSGDGSTPAAALVPSDHPLINQFRTLGRLTVTSDGRDVRADAVAAPERAAIDSFFRSCGLRPPTPEP